MVSALRPGRRVSSARTILAFFCLPLAGYNRLFCLHLSLPHSCLMSCSPHSPCNNDSNSIKRPVQIMRLLTGQQLTCVQGHSPRPKSGLVPSHRANWKHHMLTFLRLEQFRPRDLQTVIRRSDSAPSSYQNSDMIDERIWKHGRIFFILLDRGG